MVRLSFARLSSALSVAGMFAIAFMGQTARADAAACDATTLSGNYSFNVTGSFYDSQGYWYVMAMVGLSTFDGAGNFKGNDVLSLDGTIHKRTITGTYTMNADCTGTITIIGSDNLTFVGNLVLTDTKTIEFIDNDPNLIFSGAIKKQVLPGTVSAAITPAE